MNTGVKIAWDMLGDTIKELEQRIARWLEEARTKGLAKEVAILEETDYVLRNSQLEYRLGNFNAAHIIADNARELLERAICRILASETSPK